AQGEERVHARIVEITASGDVTQQTIARVELLEGPDAGEIIEAIIEAPMTGPDLTTVPMDYEVGDEVVVSRFGGPAGGFASISDRWRVPLLGALLGLFAAAVVVVGGWRGLKSLLALALTLMVVIKLVIPLLLRGWDPVPVAVVVATGLTVATLLLTEGARRSAYAAIIGTAASLALTALLAAGFTALARFSSLQGSEEVAFLIPLLGASFDPSGLLLAGTIFGALGVLDDVTMTQAATVEQLRQSDPTASSSRIIGRAMEVGRSHIAATVNTLVLAYLGAGLPLLLLFAVGGPSPPLIINGEIVAVEVVRTLVGSIGIVAAVPLTTVVATYLLRRRALPA
ncbi:MAG TPA: YibE/F family protein, partial [Candidatus Limnocylindria bacterium]|nr:YibE/F family protein [Candidatus Limnocylindria bacterium]